MVPGWGMEFGMGIGLEFQPSVSAAAVAAPVPTTNVSPAYFYGFPSADTLPIDDLLDFSNHDLFPSSADTQSLAPPPPDTFAASGSGPFAGGDAYSSSDHRQTNDSSAFTDELYIPCEEAAELEWLSKFVEDSFSDVPYPSSAAGYHLAPSADPGTLVPGRGARSKRSRASNATTNNPATTWSSLAAPPSSSSLSSATSSSSSSEFPSSKTSGRKKGGGEAEMDGGARRCTHCASEKTPQWRTGPLGPKTLCNACGVRYKSGRLVAEYRPAASPTFVLTQHSNSHRKVMELRRQKEIVLLRHDGSAASAAARADMLFHDYEVC